MDKIINSILNGNLLQFLPRLIAVMVLGYFALKFLDTTTGFLKVFKNGGYKSSKMREGLIKFTGELVAIIFVIVWDAMMGLDFYLTGVALAYLIYKEAGSILENLKEIGVNLPTTIADKIEAANPEKSDNEEVNKDE